MHQSGKMITPSIKETKEKSVVTARPDYISMYCTKTTKDLILQETLEETRERVFIKQYKEKRTTALDHLFSTTGFSTGEFIVSSLDWVGTDATPDPMSAEGQTRMEEDPMPLH